MGRPTKLNPAAVAAAIEEGLAHHLAGRLSEAETTYRRVLEDFSGSAIGLPRLLESSQPFPECVAEAA